MAKNDREITVTLKMRVRATTAEGIPTTRRAATDDEVQDFADKLAAGLPMRDVQEALLEGTDCCVTAMTCALVRAEVLTPTERA